MGTGLDQSVPLIFENEPSYPNEVENTIYFNEGRHRIRTTLRLLWDPTLLWSFERLRGALQEILSHPG